MNSPKDLLRLPNRSRLLVIAILSAMLALAACSSSSDDDVATREPEPVTDTSDSEPLNSSSTTETTTPTTVTTATTVTTVDPTTVTTTKPTSSVPPPGACQKMPPIPDDATNVSRHSADPDGDGAADELVVYKTVDGHWHLRADLARGSTIDGVIGRSGTVIIGRPFVGAHDLDRDGDDELATRAGSGAAAELVALWDLAGCELVAITMDGEPAVFPIGTSVAAATGLRCSDGYVDHLYFTDLTSRDGLVYEGRIAAFDLANSRLVDRGGEGASYPIESLGTAVGLHCGSLALT